VFPAAAHRFVYNSVLTIILILAAFSMDRRRKSMIVIAIVAIITEWIANYLDMPLVTGLSQSVEFLFFILVVIGLIYQIATTKSVTARVIVESINGYLLLGIVFSIIVMIVARSVPDAYSLAGKPLDRTLGLRQMNVLIYFSFTNYTTLGYGDIVPTVPLSRAVSTLASVSGQIYLTVIIATLVGKFLGGRKSG
jgi:hypothetical protein